MWFARVCLALVLTSIDLEPQAQDSQLDRLFATYVSGDYDVIRRMIVKRGDVEMDRGAFEKTVKRWQSDWRLVRATFLLEFAAAGEGSVPLIAQAQDATTLSHYDILLSSLEFVTRRAYGSDLLRRSIRVVVA